jgi:hypothetical protein
VGGFAGSADVAFAVPALTLASKSASFDDDAGFDAVSFAAVVELLDLLPLPQPAPTRATAATSAQTPFNVNRIQSSDLVRCGLLLTTYS